MRSSGGWSRLALAVVVLTGLILPPAPALGADESRLSAAQEVTGSFAALTETQQQEIITAYVAVLQAATGGNLAGWSDFFSSGGSSVGLYDRLVESAAQYLGFAYSNASTDSQFARAFVAWLLGNSVTAVTLSNETAYVTGLLGGGASRGSAMKSLVDKVRATPTTNATLGAAAQLLANRVTVATAYTVTYYGQSTSMSVLQGVVAQVTQELSSVNAAIVAFGGTPISNGGGAATSAATASVTANQSIYTMDSGETLRLSGSLKAGRSAGTAVDVYVQAQLSAGAPAFYLGSSQQWTTGVSPLLRGFSFSDASASSFFQTPVVAGYPPGYYQFAAIVAYPGSDPSKSSNQVAYGATTVAIRSRSQIPSSEPATLTSLSPTTATPYSTLTINGSGLSRGSAPVAVRFIPGNGAPAVTVPVSSPTSTSLRVLVPPLFDAAAGKFTAGAVDVQVVQIAGATIVASNRLAGLQIAAPPAVPAGTPAGVMTAAFLSAASEVLASTRQSIAATPQLSAVATALSGSTTSLDSFVAKANAISSSPSATYALATSKGSSVTLDAATLALTDQMFQAVAAELAGKITSGSFAASMPDCPRYPNDPLVYDTNVCATKRFFQNLSGANPAVRAEAEKALINLAVGAFGTAFGGGVPLANQLLWSAVWSVGYSYVAEGRIPPGMDVAQGVTTTAIDEVYDAKGMLGFAVDMYKVFEIAATTFPTQKGIDVSFGVPVTAPDGGTAMLFPGGALLMKMPETQGSYDSTSLVRVSGGFKPVLACAYVYSDWAACQPNGTQTRTVEKTPPGCVATTSPLASQQACTYAAPACTSYTYSDWSACSSNNTQTRTVISKSPAGCTGSGVTSQSCTYVAPSYTYTGSFTATFAAFSEPTTGCQYTARISGNISLTLRVAAGGTVTGTAQVPSSVSITPSTSTSASGDSCVSGSSAPQISGQVSGSEQSITGTLSDGAADRPYTVTFSGQRSAGAVTASMAISRTFSTTYNGQSTGFFPRSVSVSSVVLR